jgi:hypothetical protein
MDRNILGKQELKQKINGKETRGKLEGIRKGYGLEGERLRGRNLREKVRN